MSEWTYSDKVAFAADVIAEATGIHVEALLHSRRRFGLLMTARKMLVMACRKYYGMQYKTIAEFIPFSTNVLLRHYQSGVRLLRSDTEFEATWEKVAGILLRNIRQRRLHDV